MQMPSLVRPQRPLRWLALACETGLDGEALDLCAVAVSGDTGGARVDHVLDARDGEGRLGDVGRQNDPAAGVLLEDAVLLGVREAGVEGEHLGEAVVLLRDRVRGVADLPLAGEEDEDVPLALALELLDGVADRGDLVAVGVVALLFEERSVTDLDRVRTPADLDDRGVPEVPGEALGVDGRGGDDDLEVGAPGQQLGEIAQQEVDVEGPLVGLVDDDRVVRVQLAVRLDLGEQDAVRHQLDEGAVRVHLVGEAHLPADGLAQRDVELVRHALGDGAGGDTAGLCVSDHAADAAAELHADLGDLGGLTGTGLAGHDDDLVIADGRRDVVLLLADRELLGIGDGGHARGALGHPGLALGDLRLDLGEDGGPGLGLTDLARAFEPAPEPLRVAQGQLGQAGGDGAEGGGRSR
ncbi:hypothetical protein QFZ24_004806 [Streptomyces phaeochromogenes]|nr:hypothetical protein [Streptomyces phaeochromogenes]